MTLIRAIMINPILIGGSILDLMRSLSATTLEWPSLLPIFVPQSYIGWAKTATIHQRRALSINTQTDAWIRCNPAIGIIHKKERGTIINHQILILYPCRTIIINEILPDTILILNFYYEGVINYITIKDMVLLPTLHESLNINDGVTS